MTQYRVGLGLTINFAGTIHRFFSRILTTLLLLRAGYQYVPYSSHESVIERSKEAYYLGLRQTQASVRTDAPNWQPWLTFFLKSLQHQKARLWIEDSERRKSVGIPDEIQFLTKPEIALTQIEAAYKRDV